MLKTRIPARIQPEHLIAVVVFALLLLFTYAEFFEVPYVGLSYTPDTGLVTNVFDPAIGDGIKVGDLILQVGPLSWQEFLANGQAFFAGIDPGQSLSFVVERDGETLQAPFIYPGADWRQISYRLLDIWVLAYVFWAMGTVALLFIRPKDERWVLLISAAYLTALWLITGTISHWGIWNSSHWLRVVTCLIVPVFLHLHWVFPQPLGKDSQGSRVGRLFLSGRAGGLGIFSTVPHLDFLWRHLLDPGGCGGFVGRPLRDQARPAA